MTELQLRKKYINTFKAYLGAKEGSVRHKEIIDVYNTYLPHPRGHILTYNDYWCAGGASSIAIMCDMEEIFPIECSCNTQIKMFKAMGRWEEDDSHVPQIGDLVYYDWDDRSGKADNRGEVEHVGAIAGIDGNDITVIECNKNNSVEYRPIKVDGKYIRGYGLPDYASLATDKEVEDEPTYTIDVTLQEWQKAAQKDGFTFPEYGADGVWGEECMEVSTRAVIKRGSKYKNLNEFLQEQLDILGYDMSSSRKKDGTYDGIIGAGSERAIMALQKKYSLEVDGKVGINTWTEILGY